MKKIKKHFFGIKINLLPNFSTFLKKKMPNWRSGEGQVTNLVVLKISKFHFLADFGAL